MATKADSIKRGEYLVTVLGCNDCHSPKKMTPTGPVIDSALMLSGYPSSRPITKVNKATAGPWILFEPDLTAAVGPWGMSFTANLTSDDTGLGTWTEEQFFTAIRKGKYMGMVGSRNLLPPMPWEAYRNMQDGDLSSIFAYLKSLKPVKNIVPPPIPPDKL
jgi:hypothetical protein